MPEPGGGQRERWTPRRYSDADSRVIQDADPGGEDDGGRHADEDNDTEEACQGRRPRGLGSVGHEWLPPEVESAPVRA